MRGGSLTPKELKDFLTASYIEKSPKLIDGYRLDEKLSNLFGKVINEWSISLGTYD